MFFYATAFVVNCNTQAVGYSFSNFKKPSCESLPIVRSGSLKISPVLFLYSSVNQSTASWCSISRLGLLI